MHTQRDAVTNAKADLEVSKEQRETMKDVILYVLGVLSSAITTIFGYYFGSSKSSSEKNATLHEIAKKSGGIGYPIKPSKRCPWLNQPAAGDAALSAVSGKCKKLRVGLPLSRRAHYYTQARKVLLNELLKWTDLNERPLAV